MRFFFFNSNVRAQKNNDLNESQKPMNKNVDCFTKYQRLNDKYNAPYAELKERMEESAASAVVRKIVRMVTLIYRGALVLSQSDDPLYLLMLPYGQSISLARHVEKR